MLKNINYYDLCIQKSNKSNDIIQNIRVGIILIVGFSLGSPLMNNIKQVLYSS